MRRVTLDLFESKEAFKKFTEVTEGHSKEVNLLKQHVILDLPEDAMDLIHKLCQAYEQFNERSVYKDIFCRTLGIALAERYRLWQMRKDITVGEIIKEH
jgi:hypothetical protein